MHKRALLLWTGGKDSALAFYRAQAAGYEIIRLVTFAPTAPHFRAHPIPVMKKQSACLGVPHEVIIVEEPLKDAYRTALAACAQKYDIATIVTGDIALVNSQPNWIAECCADMAVEILMPLWGEDRGQLMEALVAAGFHVVISCARSKYFSADWIGRRIDEETLAELQTLHEQTGLDMCGENGEYHTLVLDGPIFKYPVALSSTGALPHDDLWCIALSR